MAEVGAIIDIPAAENLKSQLMILSGQLMEIKELMSADVSSLGEQWQDDKYEEYVAGYQKRIDAAGEISERYKEWCDKVLQEVIDKATDVDKTSVTDDDAPVGGGGSSSGSGGFGGMERWQPKNKVDQFKAGAQKVREEAAKKKAIFDWLHPGKDENQR